MEMFNSWEEFAFEIIIALMFLGFISQGLIGIIRGELTWEPAESISIECYGKHAVIMGILLVVMGCIPGYLLLLKHTNQFPLIQIGEIVIDGASNPALASLTTLAISVILCFINLFIAGMLSSEHESYY